MTGLLVLGDSLDSIPLRIVRRLPGLGAVGGGVPPLSVGRRSVPGDFLVSRAVPPKVLARDLGATQQQSDMK